MHRYNLFIKERDLKQLIPTGDYIMARVDGTARQYSKDIISVEMDFYKDNVFPDICTVVKTSEKLQDKIHKDEKILFDSTKAIIMDVFLIDSFEYSVYAFIKGYEGMPRLQPME